MINILRKDLLLILAVAAVFVSLSYAIGFVTDRPASAVEIGTAYLAEHEPKPQPAPARVWRKPVFEKIAVLNSASLKDPEKMQAIKNGNILVLDWSDLRVKEFSPDGKFLRAFGEEAKPSDGFNPTGFALDSGGNFWICDLKQERVRVFNADGSKKIYKPNQPVYRIAALGDVMITMLVPEHHRLFETLDFSGKELKSFGQFLEDQSNKGLVLDGDIVADVDNHGIIYGGRYLGVIGAYDAEGRQRYFVKTIDNVPQPMLLHIDGRMRKVQPTSARPVLSLSLLNNDLYVLSGVRSDGSADRGGNVLDVYDKQDGRYLYSWELPANAQEVVVTSNYVYIRSDNEVTVWRFKSET